MTTSLEAESKNKHRALWEAESSREFLQLALNKTFNKKGKVNLAEFSRRAGFSSRSAIVDILKCRKRLTTKSMLKINYGLKLNGDLKSLFESLIFLEEPDLRPIRCNESSLRQKIQALRHRLQESEKGKLAHHLANSTELFSTHHIFPVYAALGTTANGASVDEICFRTSVGKEFVHKTLKI